MPANRESISLGFGIEETVDSGSTELLEALTSDVTTSGDPDDITVVDSKDNNSSDDQFVTAPSKQNPPIQKAKPKAKDIKPDAQKPPVNQDEEEVDDKIDLSTLLQNDLMGVGDEEEEEETNENSTESTDQTEDQQEPIWSSLSKDLNKIGVFTPDEDEEGNEVEFIASSPEEFKEKFVNEIRKQAKGAVENFISKYGEEYQQAFENIFIKGVNPRTYFQTANEVAKFKDLDINEEKNQELVVRKSLSEQGLEDEDIDKEIVRLKNYGDLEAVSQRFHKSLIKKEETKLAELAAQKIKDLEKQKEIEEEYENNIFQVLSDKYKAKDYDGIPVNKQFAEKTMDYLTSKKFKLQSGELLTEFDKDIMELKRPNNHSLKVKYAMILQLLKTDPTLSTIKKRAVSQESNEVFQEVTRNKTKKSAVVSKPKVKSFFD